MRRSDATKRMLHLASAVLAAAALAPGAEAAGKGNLIKTFFLNTGVQPSARGKLQVVENKAQVFFMVKLRRLDPGETYDLLVDGAVVETVAPNAAGVARVVHRERKRGRPGRTPTPLPYDPRGSLVEVAVSPGGPAILSATVPTTPVESRQRIEIVLDLFNTGIIPGEAEAEFRTRGGRMKFEVEMEDVPPGSYDLLVDGVVVGQITAGALGRGRIHFDSMPEADDDDGGLDLLMTFDPRGKPIEIREPAGPEPFFTGTFPLVP